MSIHSTVSAGVAIIEIARPEKKNALTLAMYAAMSAAIAAAMADNAARALLIVGQADVFTSGNDLEDFLQHPPSGDDSPVARFMQALASCDKPVVAAVNGMAVGIGVTLLMHCDFVYVSDQAQLSMPFVALGLVPEFASTLLLPLLAGHVKAAEKLLLAEPFTGAEAVQLGLANAVLPAGEVVNHARRVAERFNALPPGAVRDTKRLMRAGWRDCIGRAMQAEAAIFLERLGSPEARQALQAFLDRRKPRVGP